MKRLRILPTGVTSKNEIGAFIIFKNKSSWSFFEALTPRIEVTTNNNKKILNHHFFFFLRKKKMKNEKKEKEKKSTIPE